jgi:undecaprenyl-diphosphatase
MKIKYLLPAGLLSALGALILFGWLAEEMLEGETQRFDAAVRDAIHGLATPWLTIVMRRFSFVGSVAVVGALILLAVGVCLCAASVFLVHIKG